jgi:uncharacterized protein (UPF0264 family)
MGPAAMLASVTGPAEALLAAALGADILDAKDPSAGALGRLPLKTIAAIRSSVPGMPLSATVGDLAPEPDALADAVLAVAAEGVDFVKVGFFPGGSAAAAIARLGTLKLYPKRLVGVLLADQPLDLDLVERMAHARFAGVMIDTSSKSRGPLTRALPPAALAEFVGRVRAGGMFAGLAGSLGLDDIGPLLKLEPDILGFRGALCARADRTAAIDSRAFAAVRAAMPRGAAALAQPARAPARSSSKVACRT